MRTAPTHAYVTGNTKILFSKDSDFWITDGGLDGEDELEVAFSELQSYGQVGKTIAGQSVGSRVITVTGAIWGDLAANEKTLKNTFAPFTSGQWRKTVNGVEWYLDVVVAQTPKITGGPYRLNYQLKLKAAYPYWRTVKNNNTLLGGEESAWFPTVISTAGSWYISKYKQSLYTNIENTGNTETAFTLTLRATAQVINPMVWSNTSRTFIKLNTTMELGDVAVISTQEDTRGCVYTSDKEQNGFRLLDPNSDLFMTLAPGVNVFRLTADYGRENLNAVISAPKGVASSV